MSIKKHKLPKVIIGLCLIGLLGFKDTGIFVIDIIAVDGNGNQTEFNKHENINLIRERDENYLIEKEGSQYNVPSDSLIRTSKTSQKYKLTDDAKISERPAGIGFKPYKKGDVFQLLKYEEENGLFEAEDGTQVYLNLTDLDVVVEDYYTFGTSKVNKVLKNGNLKYTLAIGQEVAIKDFEDNNYILLDENKNEFKILSENIKLTRKIKQTTNRKNSGNISSSMDHEGMYIEEDMIDNSSLKCKDVIHNRNESEDYNSRYVNRRTRRIIK